MLHACKLTYKHPFSFEPHHSIISPAHPAPGLFSPADLGEHQHQVSLSPAPRPALVVQGKSQIEPKTRLQIKSLDRAAFMGCCWQQSSPLSDWVLASSNRGPNCMGH
mmetsp:Transcript_19631/g.54738  ORF Transcript_19631/g.54738 Transcript_19631/m.54738 type:complete len:107 (-) Transcript_19631:1637-1957(-)